MLKHCAMIEGWKMVDFVSAEPLTCWSYPVINLLKHPRTTISAFWQNPSNFYYLFEGFMFACINKPLKENEAIDHRSFTDVVFLHTNTACSRTTMMIGQNYSRLTIIIVQTPNKLMHINTQRGNCPRTTAEMNMDGLPCHPLLKMKKCV